MPEEAQGVSAAVSADKAFWRGKSVRAGAVRTPGPSFSPYSPECVEGSFWELRA